MVCVASAIATQPLSAQDFPAGKVDLTFAAGLEGSVVAILVQPDGRLLVGGYFRSAGNFETMDGLPYVALARLHSDGQLDSSFPPVLRSGADVTVGAVVIQSEDRALIGGKDLTSGDFDAGDLFRIYLGEPAPRLSVLNGSGGLLQLTYSYAGSAEFAVLTTTNITLPGSNWRVLGSATSIGGSLYRFTDQVSPSETRRFYRLRPASLPGP